MRMVASAIFSLFLAICASGNARANWLVDEARWHASAHGQIMCLDCHGDVSKGSLHPDPARVDRPLDSSFNPALCTGCHDSVVSELEAGRHGGKPLDANWNYRICRNCHDHHAQPRISSPDAFDPTRPVRGQCGNCHEPRENLPVLPSADGACMACHREWDVEAPGAVQQSSALCLACHGKEGSVGRIVGTEALLTLDMGPEGFWPHREIACLTCHPQAAQYGHSRQKTDDCRKCHVRHDEAVARDAHLSVACGACHLKHVLPHKDNPAGIIGWKRQTGSTSSQLHAMALTDDEGACRRCHHNANKLGAAAMVLPAKSILCMPCHAATFSAGDATTILALIVFAIGLVGSFSYWFSGSIPGMNTAGRFRKEMWIARETIKTIFSIRCFCIAEKMVMDGLLQRSLYRRSPSRWLIHGLMVWPLILRFLWGLAALLASRWAPDRDWPWVLLDKNHPTHGIFFDATGLMIIAGAAVAILRSRSSPSVKLPAMPRQDRLAPGLLGAIVLIGFVLEGMRIAMTGYPIGSAYAFVGDGLSRLFYAATGLEDIYGYVWYIHALLTGAFAAYLPFSRMFHIVLAPVLLAVNAADDNKQHPQRE